MKKSITLTLVIACAALHSGCSSDEGDRSYTASEKPSEQKQTYSVPKREEPLAIAEIESETRKEIARINKERDLELQKIQQKTKLAELKSRNDLAVKEQNLSAFALETDYAFKKSTLTVVSLTLAALLALIFYIFRKRREDGLKMHHDEIEKEIYLRERELQVRMAEKILDTIASGKLSKEEERHLLEALEKAAPSIACQKQQ